ncbi:hypothetical protein TWF718_011308 [Orbilia javanica]|uniref:Uncharacterized protein n=1 Tax=Orbilia javanica TaxID=47235 RepID=A0AAN8MW77_9PEZI
MPPKRKGIYPEPEWTEEDEKELEQLRRKKELIEKEITKQMAKQMAQLIKSSANAAANTTEPRQLRSS